MQAALALFSEKGVDATTIEEITEAADLGKGTLYRHFTSKDELMAALIEDAVDRLVVGIRGKGEPRGNLQETLERLLDTHLGFFRENRDEFILLFQGRLFLKLERDEDGAIEEPFNLYLREIGKQIAPFVPQPIDPLKVRRLACAVAGFVSGFLSFAMIDMAPGEIEKSMVPLRAAMVSAARSFLGDAAQRSPL
ncbi:helix-turn-helix transcriptional regulator [Candidatus Sumerlaeota bacterium]|nr:helix-turn-helix transcriptional regulator [Candidatus Sumerlaeota bacterium]